MKLLCTLSPFWVPLLLAIGCGSAQSPPHSPEEALSTFALPESFRIELVAAEPDVIDPVAMAFDAQGRLYVVEMRDYPYHPEPQGRVKRLEDRDGDGRYEQVSIFAESLSLPNGVMPWKDGVLVTAAPDILFLSDSDADGVADERSVILTGFAATNPQLRVNGPLYGIDNWIYVAYTRVPNPVRFAKEFGDRGGPIRFPGRTGAKSVEARSHDIRFRTDDSLVERVAGNSQFGNAFDAWGNRFTVWNNDHLRHVVVQEKYLVRNPYLVNPEAMRSVSDHEKAATLFQITTEPEYIHDSQHGRFTSASGISIYSGGLFPAGYEHTSFTCDPVHNVVHRDVLVADGPTFTAKRAHEGREFLASTDSWFRPVFTTTGPDGALYVVDYHRPVVEHPEYAPKEIVDYIEFEPPAHAGRIYRIVYEGSVPYDPAKLGEASSEELVDALSHPNGWWRMTAQRLLVERSDRSVESVLQELARENKAVAKLHALWTLDGLGSLSSDLVRDALLDPEPNVREHALQLAEGLLTEEELRREALRLAQDESAKVQLQAAFILGSYPDHRAHRALEQLLADNIESPWFRTAALSAAADNPDAWLARLLRRPGLLSRESEGKRAMLHDLASIAGTRQQDMQAAKLVDAVRQSSAVRGDWWRQAVLEGLREGFGQGEKERPRLAATQRGLLALLSIPGETVRVGALDALLRIDVEATPQVDSILARAASIAADSLAPVEGRIFAIRTLGLDRSGQYTTDIAALLGPSHSEGLQVAAVETLSAVQGSDATESLLEDWRSYTGPVRTAIIGELVGHTQGISALLDAVENETVQSWSLSRGRQRQLLRHADEEIRARAEALFGESVRNERQTVYEKYRPALAYEGNVESGKEIFRDVCSECHRVGDIGSEVGPDLLSVVIRNRETLMTDILIPNESIEAGYEEYLLETNDGRSITGVMAAETPETVTLRRAKGEEDTIRRSNIASLRSLSVSPMPEDIEQGISVQGMADLLAYLKSL